MMSYNRQYVDVEYRPRDSNGNVTMGIQWKAGEDYTDITLPQLIDLRRTGKITKYVFDSILAGLHEFEAIEDKVYDAGRVHYRIRWKGSGKSEWYSDDEIRDMSDTIINEDVMWGILNAYPSTTKPMSAPSTAAIKAQLMQMSAPTKKGTPLLVRTPRNEGYAIDEDAVDAEIIKPINESDELQFSIQWKKADKTRDILSAPQVYNLFMQGKISAYDYDVIIGNIYEFDMVNEKNIDYGVTGYHIRWVEQGASFTWYNEDALREMSYKIINKGDMWRVLNAFPATSTQLSNLGLVHIPTASDIFGDDVRA